MDQVDVLKDFDFPTVMILPQKEIADAAGIATGIRRFAEAYGKPIVLYLKHDRWLPPEIVGHCIGMGLLAGSSTPSFSIIRSTTIIFGKF